MIPSENESAHEVGERFTSKSIAIYDGYLQYYMHVEPKHLSDEEWAEKLQVLSHIRYLERKASEA